MLYFYIQVFHASHSSVYVLLLSAAIILRLRKKDNRVIFMSYFVYILRCGDGTLYTGTTDDVDRRFAVHCAGKGAKYTRGRGPLALVYREDCGDKSAALKRELAIKGLPRESKLALIETAPRSS